LPKIFDNIDQVLVDDLLNSLKVSYRADYCVGYFNLRGWQLIGSNLDEWSGGDENCLRLLIGMVQPEKNLLEKSFSSNQTDIDNQTAIRLKKQIVEDLRNQLTWGTPTNSDEKNLRKLAGQLKEKKVIVKLYLRHPLHAKLYMHHRKDNHTPLLSYIGSSNLTMAGLKKQGELNVDVLEQDAAMKLSKWFENRWDDRYCIDISEELIEVLNESWASEKILSPYYIYIKIAYHLSHEARTGVNEFKIPAIFKGDLLEFQEKAVLVAAHHLNKRGGVLIGDVVGLGKTITAAALAKIFEEDFFLETLIICPKNLKNMWQDYVERYRLYGKVISLSKAQTELPSLRRYRLVIIDESQNLRNKEGKRYRAIKEYIQLNGSKVILLSATPYNKQYSDLANQLGLFLDDDYDLSVTPELFIKSIGGSVEFAARYQCRERSLQAFEKSNFADDWRELMRLFMVRRTRSFIKRHYATAEKENPERKFLTFSDGSRSYFPERFAKKVLFGFKKSETEDQYAALYSDEVVQTISELELPRYGLGNYLDNNKKTEMTSEEIRISDNLSRAGRALMGFCRTNLFKRLESSGYAFLLSLCRHVLRNMVFVHAASDKQMIPIGKQEVLDFDDFIEDHDWEESETIEFMSDEKEYLKKAKEIYENYRSQYQGRFQWIDSRFFKPKLKEHLIEDARKLLKIINDIGSWQGSLDRKLKSLEKLVSEKHGAEKVLIFTQFSDTAQYIYSELKRRGVQDCEVVTGDSEDPTYIAGRFSPVSNKKSAENQIRILISTDVLSEGQNLQDAFIIVNFDLPWALIRLVQRAGRVDRIGQRSEKIICYSFLPENGLEDIITLRGRLSQRIKENAEVVGSDEVFFSGDPVNVADLYSEKSGILDDDDDDEVDLSSYAYQIYKDAVEKDKQLEQAITALPNVVYSTLKKSMKTSEREGVVVFTRTASGNDILSYVNKEGDLISQAQLGILKEIACKRDQPKTEKLKEHHDLVAKSMVHIKQLETHIGGTLGKKTGARYRVYNRLQRYYSENQGTLFLNANLKTALEMIYRFQLKEFARETLNRQLKSGIDDADLSELVIALMEENKLCHREDREENDTILNDQIICSLGLKNLE